MTAPAAPTREEIEEALARHRASRPVHVLVVKPCEGCKEAGEPTCACIPQQWDVSIVCPGVTDNCRTWWECVTCSNTPTEEWDDLEESLERDGAAHGEEHQRLDGGWSTPGKECWGQEYPDLYDAVEGLFGRSAIQPGEYWVRLLPDDQMLELEFVDDPTVPAS